MRLLLVLLLLSSSIFSTAMAYESLNDDQDEYDKAVLWDKTCAGYFTQTWCIDGKRQRSICQASIAGIVVAVSLDKGKAYQVAATMAGAFAANEVCDYFDTPICKKVPVCNAWIKTPR